MSSARASYSRLRRSATELLVGQNEAPVQLDQILGRLGVELREMEIAEDISGILIRDGKRKFIVVNESHSPARKRFTIAHEIGHLVLHATQDVHVDHTLRINLRDSQAATGENVEEVEANAFAANLLMPMDWLREAMDSDWIDLNDDSEVARLAGQFEVSPQAMLIRLTTLFGR